MEFFNMELDLDFSAKKTQAEKDAAKLKKIQKQKNKAIKKLFKTLSK